MLDRLLESNSRKERSTGVAVVSVTAHTAIIAAAIYATAQARVQPVRIDDTFSRVYFPRQLTPALTQSQQQVRPRQPLYSRSLVLTTPNIDITLPRLDVDGVISKPGDFGPGTVATGADAGDGGRPTSGDGAFRADQVEKQVAVAPGNPSPRYPDILRSSGIEGRVTALFIVSEEGRVEENSVRFAQSDNRLFEDAVRVALRRMRFIPAEVGGRKVRQLVQMPFVFTLSR
jgi:protein TonB